MKIKLNAINATKFLTLAGILVILFFCSFIVGRYFVAPETVLAILLTKVMNLPQLWTSDAEQAVVYLRLPRIVAAVLIGAALASAGAAYQGLFKNPLVSPDVLGVSAGASFGAALGILLSFNAMGIQGLAFLFGLLAVMFTYSISKWLCKNGDAILFMILAGIIVGTLFTSFVSLIKYVSDPESKLPQITFWLMGSLASVTEKDLGIAFVPIVSGMTILTLLRWQLNIMSFGDEEAKALGVNIGRLRLIVIVCATLVTASAVSLSGMISLVGLIVPHLARLLFGANYKILFPASILLGGIFLLLVDDLARSLYTVEIPLGILTSIIGAPFFLYLLANARSRWT